VFLAEPASAYRLAYGGELAAPRYDTAAIRAALAVRAVATPATLGPEAVVATRQPAAEPVRLLADGRFQIAVIAVLAVILAVALFRAAQRLDAQSPPSAE
jgi:small neutral amino acid transporter SnatA (MarC family)